MEESALGVVVDKWYDVFWFASADNNNWTDPAQAEKYMIELEDIDEETAMKGCRWTVVYSLNAFSMIFVSINTAILAIGAYNLRSRMIGMACCPLIGCL